MVDYYTEANEETRGNLERLKILLMTKAGLLLLLLLLLAAMTYNQVHHFRVNHRRILLKMDIQKSL